MKMILLVLFSSIVIILAPAMSFSDIFKNGKDFLSYANEKMESVKFEEYDITVLKIVEENPLTEEQLKEKINQGMERLKILGLSEDSPTYTKMYNEYYDLYKNKYSNRIYKLRIYDASNFYFRSDTQYLNGDIDANNDKDFLTTIICDKKMNKTYRIQHNGNLILELEGDKTARDSALYQMLVPETTLSVPCLYDKKNPPNVKWAFNLVNSNKQPSNLNQQTFEFTVNNDICMSYDVSESDMPQLTKVTATHKNVKQYEMSFSDYAHIKSKDIDITKNFEIISFDNNGKIKKKETYNLIKFDFENVERIENIESYLSSFKGYEYCILEGTTQKPVGKIDQTGKLKMYDMK